MTLNKYKHFYWNKYIVSRFTKNRYYISYDFKHKALWFRVYKVASRTIDRHLRDNCGPAGYIYSSPVGYLPSCYKNFFKFAFVREPVDRFLSMWRDKVLKRNHFNFGKDEYNDMQKIENFVAWVKKLDLNLSDIHVRPQFTFIDLNEIDFLGKFENFTEDFSYVAEKLNLKLSDRYHLNRTNNLYEQEISDTVINEIKALYHKDIMLFYPNHL